MKSPIIKLAAAAVIIIAVSLALHFSGGPDITSITWGNVAENIKNIGTYSFRMRTIETTGPRKEGFEFVTERETIVYYSEQYGERTESYMNGEIYTQTYTNLKKNEFTGVMMLAKEYEQKSLSKEQIQRLHDGHPKKIVLRALQSDYSEIGPDVINGKEVRGIKISDTTVFSKSPMPIKNFTASLWIDTQTELPVWVEISYTAEGSNVQTTLIIDQFQWNIELPASDFEPNIPDDYAVAEEHINQRKPQQEALSAGEPSITQMDLPDVNSLTLLGLEDIMPETVTTLVGFMEVWKAQDRTVKTWPPYADMKQELYDELQAKLGIENLSSEQLMATAVALREKFWDKGGRLSQTSYPYGYAARILLEIAHDKNPENLTITDELVDTMQTIELFWSFKPDSDERIKNTELRTRLKQIRDEQFEQIKQEFEAGRELTWEDFVRVNDLAILCGWIKDFEQGLVIVAWLIEHAELGGWTAYLQPLENMQSSFNEGKSYNYNILINTGTEFPEEYRYHGLPSFKGPRKRAAKPFHILVPNPVWH